MSQTTKIMIAIAASNYGITSQLIGASWFIASSFEQEGAVGFYMGISLLVSFVALILFSLVADKYSPKQLMIVCNALQIALTLGCLVALLLGTDFVAVVSIFAILGIVLQFLFTAISRKIIYSFEEVGLMQGNIRFEIFMQAGTLVATLGFSFLSSDINILLVTNAVAYAISLFFIMGTKLRVASDTASDRTGATNRTGLQALRGFISYLWRNKLIVVLIVVYIPEIVTIDLDSVLPVFIQRSLNASSEVYGLSETFYAVGALCAGFTTAFVLRKIALKVWMSAAFVICFLLCNLIAIDRHDLLLPALFFVMGLAVSSLRITLVTCLMKAVPEGQFGAISSLGFSMSLLVESLLSFALAGLVSLTQASLGFVTISLIFICGLIAINKHKVFSHT